MQAARILPDLQCSLFCEEVRQEANGNLFIIGVMNQIRVPQVPIAVFRVSVFNRWVAGLGQFTECVRFLAPDETTVLRKNEIRFELRDSIMNSTNVTVFSSVEFKGSGVYYVEVLVDDVLKLRYGVPVVVVPPPNQPAPPPTAG